MTKQFIELSTVATNSNGALFASIVNTNDIVAVIDLENQPGPTVGPQGALAMLILRHQEEPAFTSARYADLKEILL